MKKIAFLINSLSSGGAEHQLVELCDGLVKRGHRVFIVTYTDVADHYICNSEVERVKLAVGKSKMIKILSIWKYFLKVDADWVVGFGQRESCLCILSLLFRSRKKIRAVAGERNTTKGTPDKYERLLARLLYKRAEYIIPNSYSQKKHIVDTYPEYAKKTVTITNFTDTSIYTPSPLPSNKIVRIVVIGRYSPQKNYLRFVEAIRILKEITNVDFTIDWYGDQHYKGTEINPHYMLMEEKVEELGLQNVIFLKNHIKDITSVMPLYDAFCLPSLYEGFSNAISEAICCGKPCLVSNVADNSIMVKDGDNGFLFNPEDVNSIANAFQKFFDISTFDRQQMGNNSRKLALELFDKDRFVSSYEKLFNCGIQ